jgi:deoxyribodipyrimidine photo-lyase
MQHIPITEVVSNRESGTQDTFERDIKVKRLFQEKHVSWKEYPRLSIKRGSESRKNWSSDWEKQVRNHF